MKKLGLTALCGVMLFTSSTTAHATERLLPGLGNTGYDVQSYAVAYDYYPGKTQMPASVDITARAEQTLSSFTLDAVARQVKSVTVNGLAADQQLDNAKEKLTVRPRIPLLPGLPFQVRITFVADRSLEPRSPSFPEQDNFDHWTDWNGGFELMGQPNRSHLFFPMNDLPSDKARVSFRVSVPKGYQAVANGTLRSERTKGARTTYVFGTRDPIPTHVAQLAVGHLTEFKGTGPHGLPLRSFIDSSKAKQAGPRMALVPGQLKWVEQAIGAPYPFETYGVLGVGGVTGYALESATLSMFNADYLTAPPSDGDGTMIHELVHQYFGNAVSVKSWDDMWLSEGHAAYYTGLYQDSKGQRKLVDFMRDAWQFESGERPKYGPPGRVTDLNGILFGTNPGGAVTLYALRQKLGVQTFQTIEKTFFERYRNKAASTQDYIDVVNEVSGQELKSYVKAWIYGAKTPPFPG
ncbi:M1 family metallopeptidase [Kribbella sp. NPDC051587]|uniref:M1 family metallopeptidase n=1 Tax=Kribbella sp. NPDC051587 TaxID=3364119 RepID=UPI0037A9161B